MALFKHRHRGLFPRAAPRLDGVWGCRNQSTPQPVYFIIHCIAKLWNIFFFLPSNKLEAFSSISKGILSEEALGVRGFGGPAAFPVSFVSAGTASLCLISIALLHFFYITALCK